MRIEQFCALLLISAAVGCTVVVDHALDDKPSSVEAEVARPDAGASTDAALVPGRDASAPANNASSPANSDAAAARADAGPGAPDAAMVDSPDAAIPTATPAVKAKLCVGAEHACALSPSGKVTCWGSALDGALALQEGERQTLRFIDIACGDYHTCGVTSTGNALCVGRNRDAQSAPAASGSDFVEISAGDAHSCARRSNGAVACWGSASAQQSAAPPDGFTAISTGTRVSCGILLTDRSLRCWGDPADQRATPPSSPGMRKVDMGGGLGCAIDDGSNVHCWGANSAQAPVLQATDVAVGSDANYTYGSQACALLSDGRLNCWGNGGPRMLPGPYVAVGVGPTALCMLPVSGELECVSLREDDVVVTRRPQPYPSEP